MTSALSFSKAKNWAGVAGCRHSQINYQGHRSYVRDYSEKDRGHILILEILEDSVKKLQLVPQS